MTEVALCQCTQCLRYLARNRDPESTLANAHRCEECYPGTPTVMDECGAYAPGIPLADIRGSESLPPLQHEVLALVSEECAEVIQRVAKIVRWGFHADFEGTTQTHKLEVELGDVIAAIAVAAVRGLVDADRIQAHAFAKLQKFREDAAGPRQRLRHAFLTSEDA